MSKTAKNQSALTKREELALETIKAGPIRCVGRNGRGPRLQYQRGGKRVRIDVNRAALNGLVKKGCAHSERYFSGLRITAQNHATGAVTMQSYEICDYWLDGQKLPEF